MRKLERGLLAGLCGILLLTLTGCSKSVVASSTETQSATFGFTGRNLDVKNPSDMEVTFSRGDSKEVLVKVVTETQGKDPSKPGWSLSGNSLDLGSPCKGGFFGLCEGKYDVVIPHGVRLTLDGRPIPRR